MLNKAEFLAAGARAQQAGYAYVACADTRLGDTLTPVSVFAALCAEQPNTYLFESVHGGERWGRYSIIGLPCREWITVSGRRITHKKDGKTVATADDVDPFVWLREFVQSNRVYSDERLPRFAGGLVGVFAFDWVRALEQKLQNIPKRGGKVALNEDVVLLVSRDIIVFDNSNGRVHSITAVPVGDEDAFAVAQSRMLAINERLRSPYRPEPSRTGTVGKPVYSFAEADFKRAVSQVRDMIVRGECMQVVLSQRADCRFTAPPFQLYRALRALNPSPYLYYLSLAGKQIVGSSPEILVRVEGGEVIVRPIAGTRPRGIDEQSDQQLEQALLADAKERAEHTMLVDLSRNDIGRVCDAGSLRVVEQMRVERYSHVMHIVSEVRGKLADGMDALDALAATFPAGTVSGAPKVRALEIIYDLEPCARGIYAGAVGYIGWQGSLDTAIAIRTAVINGETLSIQGGAGIVHDSDPDAEWHETMNKTRVLHLAAQLAVAGLDLQKVTTTTGRKHDD